MMMAIDVDANTCLWLARQGYQPVTIAGSHEDLTERFSVDLGPDARMMFQMMKRAAAMMNTGQGHGAFVVNDRVFQIKDSQPEQPPADPLPGIEVVINEF